MNKPSHNGAAVAPCAAARSGAPWRRRATATLAGLAVAASVSILGSAGDPAYAIDYPSWQDVESAVSNEQAKAAEIERIEALLAQLAADVQATQDAASKRGDEYNVAVQKFDEADYKLAQLQTKADTAQARADESKLRAGQLAARLARTGGDDVSASLFFDAGSADDLLEQLGMASKITDQSAGIYAKAVQDQNVAETLGDQAEVAKVARGELADAAEAALQAANDAADAAAAALLEQEDNKAVLDAQLAVLAENRQATQADYDAGVAARAAAAAELLRQRQAALAASAAAAVANGSIPPGSVSPTGWALPASGRITSPYGMRLNPYTKVYALHAGVDIGAGCGQAIYAGHAGTVTYSGPNGGYGNFIQIANGDGLSTAYGHIIAGGLLVGRGQQVEGGQLIALVGSTGGSTGCHLHYEVRMNGGAIDPVLFMRQRGVQIG